MGQWDVHEFLGKNPEKWFTTRQLSEQLGVSVGSVMGSVRKLRETGLVEFRKMKWISEQMRSSRDIFAYRFREA